MTQTAQTAARYDVVDHQTMKVVRSYKSRDDAYDCADRKDHVYGAVRYTVKAVWADQVSA